MPGRPPPGSLQKTLNSRRGSADPGAQVTIKKELEKGWAGAIVCSRNSERQACKAATSIGRKRGSLVSCGNSPPPAGPVEGEGDAVTVKVADTITSEREKLISENVRYIERFKEIPKTTAECYKMIRALGKGSFGRVTLCLHKLTGKHVAIKSIDKARMQDESAKRKILREVYILKTIRHANVIRLLEVFETEHHVHIVMEHAAGGDLLQFVKKRRRLAEPEAKQIFRQIVYGLGHIHSRSVLHRDIKLDNILLDSDRGVKICDFGISRVTDGAESIRERCGTPAYLAPELLSDRVSSPNVTMQEYSGFLSDHWSLGVLLFTMLFGSMPFKADKLPDLAHLIRHGQFAFPSDYSVSEGTGSEKIRIDARDLISGLLRVDPKERLSIPQILAHRWMRTGQGEDAGEEKWEDQTEVPRAADVSILRVQNLYKSNDPTRLRYEDYCYIANDFYTQHIDEEALRTLESFGYPREIVTRCMHKGELNHAVASYNLLTIV